MSTIKPLQSPRPPDNPLSVDYPRMMYHRSQDPVIIQSEEEEAALGPEWSRTIPAAEPPAQEPKSPPPKQTKAKRDAKGRYVDTSH
jgi:hypothetical protein